MDLDAPRHRPLVFDKMESLIKEMQDPETGVPVRSQKLFLTSVPAAFMGYDLVEWLIERFNLDECNGEFARVEAVNLANLLCQYGYFFPVNDYKNLVLKDDSTLYRFQSPYYWPWQPPKAGASAAAGPDNVEHAIYLVKRTLRNKQRHGLEEYEAEALASLKKNLAGKWEFISMQAEEQVRLAKERKKGDKIVSDSQERAYWRVMRPPPGLASALDACPVPPRPRSRKRTDEQLTREIEELKASLDRTRVKTSIALEALVAYSETFAPYDPWLTPPQPSNPWVSDDTLFWQINSPLVDVPSEKRVQRWAISMEELVADPTGVAEFTSFLRKEYSHENIRFWLAVCDLRRASAKDVPRKLDEIYEEFLAPGAPCEINIDGATAEGAAERMRARSRYALDVAAEHVYSLLLKKDCYPRFVRSDHFQRLLADGRNVHQKKAKFFNFGGQVKKKSTTLPPTGVGGPGPGPGLARRRGSERSLSGSAHELAVSAAQPSHSVSQTNLAPVLLREPAYEEVPAGRRAEPEPGPSERRRLPQQSTLDGGLRGAAPPLRRLSAVEPRHLVPVPAAAGPAPADAAAPAADDDCLSVIVDDEVPVPVMTVTVPEAQVEVMTPAVELAIPVAEIAIPVVEVAIPVVEVALPVVEVALPVVEVESPVVTPPASPVATPETTPVATPVSSPAAPVVKAVAPLAESEDTAEDDEDKVPEAPRAPADLAAPAPPPAPDAPSAPAAVSAAPSAATAAPAPAAPAAAPSAAAAAPAANDVKRNKFTAERKPRNDICPWEDE